jgi:hypothetical protein
VDIRFLPPELRRLDEASVELAIGSFWLDRRPLPGLAGLLDWRLAGRLSAIVASGFARGEEGELLLVPGKPHVPFEKVLLLGLGARAGFDEDVFRRAVRRMASALEGLRVRRAVVELPGRSGGGVAADTGAAIDAERAIALTLECLGTAPEHDAWWLVEDAASQQKIEQRVRVTQRVASISDA